MRLKKTETKRVDIRKLESDYDEEFEMMSVDDIANWLSDYYDMDVEANLDGDILTLNVKIDELGTLPIALERESSGIDTSTWYATFDTPNYVYSKEFRLNADDERAYAAELAMKYAKSKNWFKDDFKDEEDTEESFRRTHRRIESRRMRNRRVNEAYTSFTRWANAIERQYAKLDWKVATPKYHHPSCVWNGDIYCEFTDRSQDPWKHYIAGVSDSPDGQQVAVYVFEGYDAPYKEVMNDIVLRSQIENAINKNKDKIPEELLKEMVGMFRMFKLK